MRLKTIYSFFGYGIIVLFLAIISLCALVDFLESIDYAVKGSIYFVLLSSCCLILWFFRKKSKESPNLTLIFSVFGQLSIVFIIFAFGIVGYQSPEDIIFKQELSAIKNSELNPEFRLYRCEKTFFKHKDRNFVLVKDIESVCRDMLVDISRRSPLNIIPALDTLARLESFQNKKGTSDLSPLRVCLIAESGHVDRALMIAERDQFHSIAQNLKNTGRCKVFARRSVASEAKD